MSTNTVGGKIAEARARVTPYLSQQELAKRLKDAGIDISTAGVAEIEAGKRSLNYYQVTVLASILNTTVHQLHS
ncbi:MAG: helix-turn-helix transcriptional regulator [bacterium]|jgi:hypothetical protein